MKFSKEFGSFEHELPWTPGLVRSKCYIFLHHNLATVDWLCCACVSGPKFGSVTESPFSKLQTGEFKETGVNICTQHIHLHIDPLWGADEL